MNPVESTSPPGKTPDAHSLIPTGAKSGIVLAVASELGLPVTLISAGEPSSGVLQQRQRVFSFAVWGPPAVKVRQSRRDSFSSDVRPPVARMRLHADRIRKAFLDGPFSEGYKRPQPREFVCLSVRFFLTGATKKDYSNLLKLVEDALQGEGMDRAYQNDSLVVDYGHSCAVSLCSACPLRKRIERGSRKGQLDKDCGDVPRCPYTRSDITLEVIDAARYQELQTEGLARRLTGEALNASLALRGITPATL